MRTSRQAAVPRWLARDAPDFLNLRKAGRAAIVSPLVLAFGLFVIGNDSIATFSVFAAIVGLVFADYGGPPLRRAGAYLTMLVAGNAVIVVGGLFASLPIAGVIATFVVAVLVNVASAFGGYWSLHVSPVILAYSLSVLVPTDDLVIIDRMLGWTIGSVAAMVAALVLWPTARRIGLRDAVATAVHALADVVADPSSAASSTRIARLRDAVGAVQRRLSSPLRPFGTATRDIALLRLIEHIEHCSNLVDELADGRAAVDEDLLRRTAAVLRRAGDILTGSTPPEHAVEDLAALDQARASAIAHLTDMIADPDHPISETPPLVTSRFPGLALSHLSIWMEYEALRAVGATPALPVLDTAPEMGMVTADTPTRRLTRAYRMLVGHLAPGGFILRNSVRAGIALAAAVAAADILPVEHGFWIVLGTLSVLRSGASSTYATALQAIGGTVAGIAVAVPLVAVAADSPVTLWITFIVCAALAAYTPGAIHFAVGQAAFTVFVVSLFGLLSDPGAATAVIRVETVAVGAVTAIVLSLVLWPRGARTALGRAVAREYTAAARCVETMVSGEADARTAALGGLDTARRGAEATFAAALNEHKEPIEVDAWIQVLQPPTLARALSSGLVAPVTTAPRGCSALLDADRRAAAALSEQLTRVGAWLETGRGAGPAPARERDRTDDGPCIAGAAHDRDAARIAVDLLAWSSYIERLSAHVTAADPALRDVADARARATWPAVASDSSGVT